MKKKLQREVEGLLQREEDLVAENSRLEKSRKKMQEEVSFYSCREYLQQGCLEMSVKVVFLWQRLENYLWTNMLTQK